MTRYVVERVAREPEKRRIKDTLRNRYVKQPHGDEIWPSHAADVKAFEMNLLWPSASDKSEGKEAPAMHAVLRRSGRASGAAHRGDDVERV